MKDLLDTIKGELLLLCGCQVEKKNPNVGHKITFSLFSKSFTVIYTPVLCNSKFLKTVFLF